MNCSSKIFFSDINYGHRAAILKKNSLSLRLLIAIMKRRAEQCAMQLYRTSLILA